MSKKNLFVIKDLLVAAVSQAGFELGESELHLEKTRNIEHGDFSSNVAMLLAGKLKKNPREVAQAIVDALDSSLLTKVDIAGPGFINLWLSEDFYQNEAKSMLADFDAFLVGCLGENIERTVLMDYSHPNIAKPMGVHHLLSTIIGDSIKRVYRRAGWKVVADNFIGDMGTQFGKLMHAIREWGNVEAIEKDPITELQKLYVKFHEEAEEDESLDDAGRSEYRKFEEGDVEARKMWEKIVKWSLAEIQPIYDALGVEFDVMNGESFYEDKMAPILEAGRSSGVIVDGEKGAWIIPAEDPEATPVLVRKSDGATLYATRDLARTKYWEDTWSPELMVMVTDVSQEFHFKQVFYAVKKLALTSALNVNVNFGRMNFKDAKMSTRKGNILLLDKVLEEAGERAVAKVEEKADRLTESEKASLAKLMGINSIKYNVLSQNRSTNITFDWDKMLSFDGNSAPYLMYTIARAKSVLRKAGVTLEDCAEFELQLGLDIERKLMVQLLTYSDSIQRAMTEFKPNHVANYLHELASDFNSFYNGNSIIKADSELTKKSRLLITASVIKVMEDGFDLLGLKVPEKM